MSDYYAKFDGLLMTLLAIRDAHPDMKLRALINQQLEKFCPDELSECNETIKAMNECQGGIT